MNSTAPFKPGITNEPWLAWKDREGSVISLGDLIVTRAARIYKVTGQSGGDAGHFLNLKSDDGRSFPILMLSPDKVRECLVAKYDPAYWAAAKTELPFAEQAAVAPSAATRLKRVREYHQQLADAAFTRGSGDVETLHRHFTMDLDAIGDALVATINAGGAS